MKKSLIILLVLANPILSYSQNLSSLPVVGSVSVYEHAEDWSGEGHPEISHYTETVTKINLTENDLTTKIVLDSDSSASRVHHYTVASVQGWRRMGANCIEAEVQKHLDPGEKITSINRENFQIDSVTLPVCKVSLQKNGTLLRFTYYFADFGIGIVKQIREYPIHVTETLTSYSEH